MMYQDKLGRDIEADSVNEALKAAVRQMPPADNSTFVRDPRGARHILSRCAPTRSNHRLFNLASWMDGMDTHAFDEAVMRAVFERMYACNPRAFVKVLRTIRLVPKISNGRT